MRVIINDKRYGALKTLGERKQVFNEVGIEGPLNFFFRGGCTISLAFIKCRYIELCSVPSISAFMLQFLGEKKKREIEERRNKQKKAREDFTKMLEVSYSLL